MAKRKERNMSGQFIAVVGDNFSAGPFTGREAAIKAAKEMLPTTGEASADIYHRVCQVKAKNLKETDNGETQSDVPFDTTEPIQDSESRTAL